MEPKRVIPIEVRKDEIPSIRLKPEQIEEIHADEYSLTLFYATRIEPLSLEQIKRRFPEPEAKKAQAVLERYIRADLIHKTPEGKYYSNYPDHYINYSDYRYDALLESKKDQRIFDLMKEHTGKKIYWEKRSYFSIDAFFSEEQTKEIQDMFGEIRRKAKQFSSDNKGKAVDKLKFRRMKFYDMFFSIMLVTGMLFGLGQKASAGANPFVSLSRLIECNRQANEPVLMLTGGGNDPRARAIDQDDCLFQDVDYKTDVMPDDGHEPITIGPEGLDNTKKPAGGGHEPTKCGPRTTGGGHEPQGCEPPIVIEEMSYQSDECDWSRYANLLSYSAVEVCKRIAEIRLEPACMAEIRESCGKLGSK